MYPMLKQKKTKKKDKEKTKRHTSSIKNKLKTHTHTPLTMREGRQHRFRNKLRSVKINQMRREDHTLANSTQV